MHPLIDLIQTDSDLGMIAKGFEKSLSEQWVTGLSGSARHLYTAALHTVLRSPLLIVTHNLQQAQQIYEDMCELLPAGEVFLFPERELSYLDILAYSPEQAATRLNVLEGLVQRQASIVIAPLAAVYQPLPNKQTFTESVIKLSVGDEVNLDSIVERLVYLGYERSELVESKGQFSVRGGILDVFPLTMEMGVRVELFDVEVDSIRTFDPTTQRSQEKRNEISFWPIREVLIKKESLQSKADQIYELLDKYKKTVRESERAEKLEKQIGREIELMREGIVFPGLIRYLHLIDPSVSNLLGYLPADAILVYDEPTRLRETVQILAKEQAEWQTAALEQGELMPAMIQDTDRSALFFEKKWRRLFFSLFPRTIPGLTMQQVVHVSAKAGQNFHGQMNILKGEMERWRKTGSRVIFLAAGPERAERLQRVLEDYGMEADSASDLKGLGKRPVILHANLTGGFELISFKLVIITENEVFANKRKAKKFKGLSDAQKLKSYQDLKVGDFVVHLNHGIGQYLGIETLVIEGNHKDYLHIKYKGKDKLYVPVEQIDLVQKYIGSEEKEPKLYSLGGTEWARVKSKVQNSVKDIAEDLIKLYAARQATPGYAASPDTQWQREFEAMFPYEETADQLRAIAEIKKDMETPRPMDRLLCGDVGYGKTEVAIRAAFKAVMDGKQVAVLVPTTILAQQHYETFKERCTGFPIKVEVISRFRTQAQMKAVLKGLSDGSVDIVIGTHRLLNKSVKFKDLGLLVIDEEQRFGVSHKEKIKQIKNNVDCLTLTATPIPRTLHMSMLGIRDLSVIETPPENRFPVQTYVAEYSDVLVREAIERELGRGGQVYFLYNKVKDIEKMADHIRTLVPEARVLVGHGQMGEEALEHVMLDFLEGEADVLVSTTIIETGLDIPNVNTLIVYDADHMGLSQLYQLRGRVGRSNRVAYAYFTYQRDKVLTEVAEKRLQAIKEFTELGSGFKIAMRDLSIRGAGNLLGAEQHGFIASVGFDLYSDMLSQAIQELKGEKQETIPDPQVELAVDAYIPSEYIRDTVQKIEIYKKFVSARSLSDIRDLEEEMEDRFGDIPLPVRNLLTVTQIKSYARQFEFQSIVQDGHDVVMKLSERQNQFVKGEKLFALTQQFPDRVKLTAAPYITITLRVKGLKDHEVLEMIKKFLESYPSVLKTEQELQRA
ncbi:transcription-repair coupling factor [Effusibacillus dendaii]|uniref:Transcription-repair-coupling factor n=1 Tax=Effusibacillus dendaii TaxID=2743772 RepID=A0A7I8DBP8_9BACL|nr:transcription-repair coupling factor [Effusibacillus dendaii]BCJ87407.1 transcription-repair-coupling factor [Effusibacillus dendaii]